MKRRPKVLYNKRDYRISQTKSRNNASKLHKQCKKKGLLNYHKQRDDNVNILPSKINQETINSSLGDSYNNNLFRYEDLINGDYYKLWANIKNDRELTSNEKRYIDWNDLLSRKSDFVIIPGNHDITYKKLMKEKSFVHQSISTSTLSKIFLKQTTTDKWLKSTSFWIPRRIREAIIGDIIEDCHELRALGKKEYRVRLHILWHLILFALSLLPTAIIKAFKEKVVSE